MIWKEVMGEVAELKSMGFDYQLEEQREERSKTILRFLTWDLGR